MRAYPIQVVDCLSLLTLKVASNVFDLSSGLHHVSIRDQIVRAQLAVRDLKKGDPSLQSLMIVGAGIAGIAAALEAVDQGIDQIVVVEAGDKPFGLLRGVKKRFVGPFLYEWPSSFSRDQSYPDHRKSPWEGRSKSPLEWRAWEPMPADKLAMKLELQLNQRLQSLRKAGKTPPAICVGINKSEIKQFVRGFAQRESARALSRLQCSSPLKPCEFRYEKGLLWPTMKPSKVVCKPQYVLLAAGMGAEKTFLVQEGMSGTKYTGSNYLGTPFWSDDTLLDSGTENLQLSIFGGGDGALQDVLRALTRRDHPLKLLTFLERDPRIKASLGRVSPRLLDAERQSRLFGTWTQQNGEYLTIDTICQQLARGLARQSRIARRISQCIVFGRGRVSLFVRGKHFDKAYLLNRFLVHLIRACKQKHPDMWAGRMDFEVNFEQSAVNYTQANNGQHCVTIKRWDAKPVNSYSHTCDRIAVRYGIMAGTVPGAQMIQVSTKPSNQRTTLARVELPFVVESV